MLEIQKAWVVYVPGKKGHIEDTTSFPPHVSFWQRPLSCLLGTEFLGVLYYIRYKLLTYMLIKLGFNVKIPTASFTGGLVGDSSPFAVLPTITPLISLTMVLLAMAPCLVKAWRAPKPRITRLVAYAYTCGFIFGWHVHEKASLHFVTPLAIIALKSADDAKHYFLLSVVSCYSLFPLLYEPQEYPVKVLLPLLHGTLTWHGISLRFSPETSTEDSGSDHSRTEKTRSARIGWVTKCYLVSILVVEIYGQVMHPLLLGKDKLPFLPLLLFWMLWFCSGSQDAHVATGFRNHLARPFFCSEWKEDLTFEEGVKLLEKCMRVLLYRDRSAISKIQIAKISEEGAAVCFKDILVFLSVQESNSWC